MSRFNPVIFVASMIGFVSGALLVIMDQVAGKDPGAHMTGSLVWLVLSILTAKKEAR